jgi:serine/threonine protein kinase
MCACRNVVHRDLKLENLLLASPDEITKVCRD